MLLTERSASDNLHQEKNYGPTGEQFYRVNLGHLTVAWQADGLLWTIVINDQQAITANSPAILGYF